MVTFAGVSLQSIKATKLNKVSGFSDQDILEAMRTGRNENPVFQFMLNEFRGGVRKFILENQGSVDDSEDLLQDGIIALREQVIDGKFRGESSIKTYHFRICRFMWLNRLKRMKVEADYRQYLEETSEIDVNTPEHLFLEEEKGKVLADLLTKTGEKCRMIMRLKFYQKKSMKEIAVEMGFKNEQPAKNKLHFCKKALKNLVKANPGLQKLLLDLK